MKISNSKQKSKDKLAGKNLNKKTILLSNSNAHAGKKNLKTGTITKRVFWEDQKSSRNNNKKREMNNKSNQDHNGDRGRK